MDATPEMVLELAENPRKGFHPAGMRPVNGKMRLITRPKRAWKVSYSWLGAFLRKEFRYHSSAHGSVPGRSPFTAAREHLGQKNLLCRDVKNAFPNVKSDRFYLELLALGFNPEIARLLTKLLLPDGYLPQGGPASNAAIDLFFYRVDCDIAHELSVLRAKYTRFTDGLDVSFNEGSYQAAVAQVIEKNLNRLGLSINLKKLDDCGWQPQNKEQIVCGVRVNSCKGTQLPRSALKTLIAGCESLERGSRSVAPHTIVGLAKKRRSIQGWLNQAGQADLAPIRELQRRVRNADENVRRVLHKCGLHIWRCWYLKNQRIDVAASISTKWLVMRKLSSAVGPKAPSI